jgi:EAL domain-containing protein (putative c-di-GMP-specific phosphodiesterase class I)
MSLERLKLEQHLQYALERGEFRVLYQPKVDAQTGEIRGVEALLRWWNHELGTITPAQFIPVAEDTGLIVAIGKWVLHQACEQAVAWIRSGLPRITMSVNLSPRQFSDATLLDDISEILEQTHMPPELLELEITESMLASNIDRAIEIACELRNLGIRLAIDDFGTGYSSMLQLKRFPLDTLKIDRSFVRDLPESKQDMAIVEAIIAMSKTLGVTVVAEGVESESQRDYLTARACDQLQGFFYGKAAHPDAIARSLSSDSHSGESGPELRTTKA